MIKSFYFKNLRCCLFSELINNYGFTNKKKQPFNKSCFSAFRFTVYKIGLPNSIGISYNKSLAKIASDMKKPMGITLIRPEDVTDLVQPLPVNKIFGIGKQATHRLNEIGIHTIKDLAEFADLATLETILGKPTHVFVERANGGGEQQLTFEHNKLKQIGNETTFEYDLIDYEDIKNKIYLLAKHVSQRAQKRTMVGNVIYVTFKMLIENVLQDNKQLKSILTS
ncbi:MAG: hypothetical protein EHV01_004025 [Spiroplasma sp. hy2]|uniref:DinB/UmuC family translesion DNA polymerase n=1 Tax=Spiroplasma sp. hy2 TaxID=2490850 RepID=UPI003B4598B8